MRQYKNLEEHKTSTTNQNQTEGHINMSQCKTFIPPSESGGIKIPSLGGSAMPPTHWNGTKMPSLGGSAMPVQRNRNHQPASKTAQMQKPPITSFDKMDVDKMLAYFSANATTTDNDDCITSHNKGMRTLLDNKKLKVGSQADLTRKKMQDAGYAGEAIKFGFNQANGKKARGNASAVTLNGSIGDTVSNKSKGLKDGQSTVFGVSILDGYHSMTLTATKVQLIGPTQDGKPFFTIHYTLSDQGTGTTDGKGNKIFYTAADLDVHMQKYITDRSTLKTRGGHEYPAKIEIHQIQKPS